MLKTRVITAVVGMGLLLTALYYLPAFTALLVLIAIGFTTHEAALLVGPRLQKILTEGQVNLVHPILNQLVIWLPTLIACLIFLTSVYSGTKMSSGILVFGFLLVMCFSAFVGESIELAVAQAVSSVFAICYGLLPWLALWHIYQVGQANAILYLLLVVWSGDTAAYFVGLKFGKTKLAPLKSPNKTVEGAIAGIIMSCLVSVMSYFLIDDLIENSWVFLFIGILCGASAQVGDLFESTLKRFAQVKDSGSVFPGHGGFLDRVDGVMFATPVLWFVLFCDGFFHQFY